MIDLHSHVLPGIDDGAVDLAESLEMCRLAAEDGTRAMIATPHLRHERYLNDDRGRLEDLWRQLCAHADGRIELFLGGEIAVHSDSVDELHQLPEGQLLTLAGSRYVLLEFDWHGYGPDPVELVHELRVSGWFPIVAHPERVAWLAGDLPLLHHLIARGAHLQLTAMSLTGALGRMPQEASQAMLDAGMVDFIASDTHGPRLRPPGLSSAFRHVREHHGNELARRLFIDHPRAVLDDRPLKSGQHR